MQKIIDLITDGLAAISDFLGKIIDGILAIPKIIINLLLELLRTLFVPADDFLDHKLDELIQRFHFTDNVATSFKAVVGFFTDTDFSDVPNVKISFGAAEGTIVDYSGTQEGLDLTWYAKYKPTVDKLISGFLWIVFLFNLYRALPGIIGGAGAFLATEAKIADYEYKENGVVKK